MRSAGCAVRHLLSSSHTVAGGPANVATAIPVGDPALSAGFAPRPGRPKLASVLGLGVSRTLAAWIPTVSRIHATCGPAGSKNAPGWVKCPESDTEPTAAMARHAHASEAPFCGHPRTGIGVDAGAIRRGSRYTEQRAAS